MKRKHFGIIRHFNINITTFICVTSTALDTMVLFSFANRDDKNVEPIFVQCFFLLFGLFITWSRSKYDRQSDVSSNRCYL